jgi:nicotinamide-nucleotide amidase
MLPADLLPLAIELLALCRAEAMTLATAESCTGGLIASTLTEIPGSSAVVDRGFVTYSNEAKTEMLGVPEALIAEHGAVSEPVARAMIAGVFAVSPVRLAVAVTGIAGPDGGSPAKPVGRVHIAAGRRDGLVQHRRMDYGAIGRTAVRLATVRDALSLARLVVEGRVIV